MLLSHTVKVLSAVLLALSIAACTTTKVPDNTGISVAEQGAADKAAADKAAADAKAAEDAAAAAAASTNTGGIDSQALADSTAKAQAEAADKANSLAALSIKTFYFDYDQAGLKNSDYEALKAHALYLSKNPAAHALIGGNTDERGTREYNMALGERRAKAVAAFLSSNGAPSAQMEVISYGEEKPAAAGDDEEAWGKSRRVELEYSTAP